MTRFIVMADTHLGGGDDMWHQQPPYPHRLPEILGAVSAWMDDNGAVDFIAHAGDMVNHANKDVVAEAAAVFDLQVPVHLCLGNHDVRMDGALDAWQRLAPGFFPKNDPNWTIETGDMILHCIVTHWAEKPYYWDVVQDPHVLPDALAELSAAIAEQPDLPHLIVTHSPVLGVPTEQTGFDKPYHQPKDVFTRPFLELADKFPQLRCVISGHNHVNSLREHAGTRFATASSLVEPRFEFKLFEVEADAIRMSTVSLANHLGFRAEWDAEKAFVTGRPQDRAFELSS